MQVEDAGAEWGAEEVVEQFATDGPTDEGEALALALVAPQARGAVLDLGFGGGRTTGMLRPRAREYVGIDVAAHMVELARERFPGADLREGAAQDLSGLPDAHFDLVVFSFNGLDSLDHEQRATALAEMTRVTAPEGRVLFSALNLEGPSFDERPWHIAGGVTSPRFRFHALDALRHPGRTAKAVHTYRETREESVDGEGWALRPLRALEFRFVVHFATLAEMVRGARAAGLEVLTAYAADGRELDPDAGHTDADYVHLVCRRG